jgi:aryl-alcohol dehydrogenase-like predicted oxidoreductase
VERRALADSGLQVSPLGLGTWAMGGAVEEWGLVDDRESIGCIHQALDLGINLIDTAPIYGLGHSEEIVGKAIQGRRQEVVLATKCGLLPPRDPGKPPIRRLARDSILRECEGSLRRLRTDVIDLYLCHWPDPETNIRETMGALTTLLEQGKIRAIGVSNFSCEQIAAAREFGPVHCLQPPFSLLNRRAADDLVPYCTEHGTAVLVYDVLAKGLLTGKFDADSSFDGVRKTDPDYTGKRYRRNLALIDGLRVIAAENDRTVAQLAINWVATHPGVTSALFGAKRPSQILENVGGVGWAIKDDDRRRIDELLRGSAVDS